MARPTLLTLEGRDLPATFGIPWPQPAAVTVSFAPDGADVDGTPSELHAHLAGHPAWQNAILRALQQWAVVADLNFGVVSDDGSALGVAGQSQSDPRFGDIRIFAVPMSNSVLAITAPPGDIGGTRAGDIILNSNLAFGANGHDLYTVLLQEVGHAIGIGNSADQASAMYEFYHGRREGLSSGDQAAAVALYGARTDAWEPAGRNDRKSKASPLGEGDNVRTLGDLRNAADQDWYSFIATGDAADVTLSAEGWSLLAGRVTAFNANGKRVGRLAADHAGQDLTLSLDNLRPGKRYFLRVDDALGAFAAGNYDLKVVGEPSAPLETRLLGAEPVDDAGTNDTAFAATELSNQSTNNGTSYRAFARLRADDIDIYRIHTPKAGFNQNNVLTVSLRSFTGEPPEVRVLNSLGLQVSHRVVADGRGTHAIVVDDAVDDVDYFVKVAGDAGDYALRVDFRSLVSAVHQVESGLLSILNPKKSGSLRVTGTAQIHFQLSALLLPLLGPSVTVTVYDAANRVKLRLLAQAGDTVSGTALLNAGNYRVEVKANGQLLPAVLAGFGLSTALLTDPVGVRPKDPNQPGEQPPAPPPSSYNYYNDRGYYVWGEKTPTGDGG